MCVFPSGIVSGHPAALRETIFSSQACCMVLGVPVRVMTMWQHLTKQAPPQPMVGNLDYLAGWRSIKEICKVLFGVCLGGCVQEKSELGGRAALNPIP